MRKTIIHVWTHEFLIDPDHVKKYNFYNETNFYFGLGDLLRSTIQLYMLSRKMGFDFFVDLQCHPIGEFLEPVFHPFAEYVLKNRDKVHYVCYGAAEDFVRGASDASVSLILTNDFYTANGPSEEIPEDCKTFMRRLLTPRPRFQSFIQQKLARVPTRTFCIMHYRVNDNEFLNRGQEIVYQTYLEHYLEQRERGMQHVLVTDTLSLKRYFQDDEHFSDPQQAPFVFDLKICHLGLSKDRDAVRDTLFEFFLITRSAKIKTHCKIHRSLGL